MTFIQIAKTSWQFLGRGHLVDREIENLLHFLKTVKLLGTCHDSNFLMGIVLNPWNYYDKKKNAGRLSD